jgi:hypothetical protein
MPIVVPRTPFYRAGSLVYTGCFAPLNARTPFSGGESADHIT